VDRDGVTDCPVVAEGQPGVTAAGRGLWPTGKRCAVAITVRLDGPLFWLRLDPASRDRAKTLSIGQYGLRRGAPRLLEVLSQLGLPSTWLVPGVIAQAEPELCRAAAELGHEVGQRGYQLENFSELTRAGQRRALQAAGDAISAATGREPSGFSAPPGDVTADTFEVLAELGYSWCSVLHGDDLPSFVATNANRPLVHLPNRWELHDAPYFVFNYEPAYPPGQGRIASYDDVLASWQAEFDGYLAESGCMVLALDAQSAGTPGKADMITELLGYCMASGSAWFATCAEIAAWWAEQQPEWPCDESERVRRTAPGAPASSAGDSPADG
jgi:peptidoglycan/xylan/chitin deacetylase (PgdA/CDA1 family)